MYNANISHSPVPGQSGWSYIHDKSKGCIGAIDTPVLTFSDNSDVRI